MNITAKRVIIGLALIAFFAFGIFAGYGIYEGNKINQMIITGRHEREEAFEKNPDLISALVLMETNFWELKEYDKANYYADFSIKLGVENTRRGWYVHMVMADIDSKNKKMDAACHNLKLALQMAKQYEIPEVQINLFKYHDLLNTCSARGIK